MIAEYVIGARGEAALVRDDADRRAFLRLAGRAAGGGLLAYCLMDTHAHLVSEGTREAVERSLRGAMKAWARRFRERSGSVLEWRGAPRAHEAEGAEGLASKIRYVHRNPLKAAIVDFAVEWPWSSLREFAGLSFAGIANVERARRRVRGAGLDAAPPRSGLDPLERPENAMEAVLAAAAQVYLAGAEAIVAHGRSPLVIQARRVFAALGNLEGWTFEELGSFLAGRAKQSLWELAEAANVEAVAAARTLLRNDGLRRHLRVAPPARLES
ncbi:MAG TPA: hypothetical protein VHF22_15555, partial [Planctomycetota bacterium]|nr:hypothetical protein [Planctomycetota bacterium]